MNALQTRPPRLPISSSASLVLHIGFSVMGIVTTLIGPLLPILIGRWSLSDRRAGLFFTAQFCGSMLGVSTLGLLLKRGYRSAFVCGFSLIALGVAGLTRGNNLAALGATALFGCGLGQALSATNLWVAETARSRRVAALSILNFTWGIGAIVCSPLVMAAQQHGATSTLLYGVAAVSAVIGLTLTGLNLEPETEEDDELPATAERPKQVSSRSAISLAALFFLYVGCENSVAGWVASLTKRMRTDANANDLWALAPMFFWAGLLAGRALVPLVPSRWRERTLLITGLTLAAAGIFFLLQATTLSSVAICVTAAGLGLAAIFPILIAWLVKAFGEKSRRISSIMFALAGMGGASMPWFVGLTSTATGSLRAGLLIPLAGCVAMFTLIALMFEPAFRGTLKADQ